MEWEIFLDKFIVTENSQDDLFRKKVRNLALIFCLLYNNMREILLCVYQSRESLFIVLLARIGYWTRSMLATHFIYLLF